MKKDKFIKYIESLQKIVEVHDKLRGTGICTIDYDDNFYTALSCLEKSIFEEYQRDLIYDYVWSDRDVETGNRKDIKIYSTETKEILYTINSPETLWEYISEDKSK